MADILLDIFIIVVITTITVSYLARLIFDVMLIVGMQDKNLREAIVIWIDEDYRFDIAQVGVKGYFDLVGTKMCIARDLAEGEMCDVYWCGFMDNWLYRFLYGGVMRKEDKSRVKRYIFAELIFFFALVAFVIISANM